MHTELNHSVCMPDGVRLATDLYLDRQDGRPRGTLLLRTPYGKRATFDNSRFSSLLIRFIERGFAVVIQDCRGRWQSEGVFAPCRHEADDGVATLDWIASQRWSNGRVGTYGCSYLGENQIFLAARRHPAHRAILAEAAGGAVGSLDDLHQYFGLYENGVLSLASLMGWCMLFGARIMPRLPVEQLSPEVYLDLERRFYRNDVPSHLDLAGLWRHLPVIDAMRAHVGAGFADIFEELVGHPLGDDYWRTFDAVAAGTASGIPTLHVNGWYDYGIDGTIALHQHMRSGAATADGCDEHRLLIFPTCHCAWDRTGDTASTWRAGAREMGPCGIDYAKLCCDWFGRWLCDEPNDPGAGAKVRVYVMGSHRWREFPSWPPAGCTPLDLHLSSSSGANSRLGDGRLARDPAARPGVDQYTYDPYNPVPSLGGSACCTSVDMAADEQSAGAHDQSALELRHDILVYTSDPLGEAMEILGSVQVELFVSSSAPDTDFAVKLVEVLEDGRAFNITETIFRCRHREGVRQELLLEPGAIVALRFALPATGISIAAGHRVRIDVTSSNFPRFVRNLNTGGDNHREARGKAALNSVHFGPEHPSRITLPIAAAVDSEVPVQEAGHGQTPVE